MKVWKYVSAFLAGVGLAFGLAFMMALKKINVTNADTVIESMEQSIKKLKQDGAGNISDMSSTISIPKTGVAADTEVKEIKPILGIRLRKKKNN